MTHSESVERCKMKVAFTNLSFVTIETDYKRLRAQIIKSGLSYTSVFSLS